MDKKTPIAKLPVSRVEDLLRQRPFYDMADDCPHTEEIANALADGTTPAELEKRFPHVQQCDICKASIHLFNQMANEIGSPEQKPAPRPAKNVISLSKRTRVSRRTVFVFSMAAVLLAGLAAGVGFVIWQSQQTQSQPDTLVPKGASYDLEIAVSRNGLGFPLREGEMVETGDRLGFFYSASEGSHMALFHVDGQRQMTVLYPVEGKRTAFVQKGERIRIRDGALVTPSTTCEWIVALFTPKETSLSRLISHLRRNVRVGENCNLKITDMDTARIKVQQIRKIE
ncbi:MAG: DUF4384 domain-containing protein [Deltaproteobacteria bacterium]|nr:DUF4384 domain-containing protein [Deltaproteobacteria bacterium]